MYASWDEPRPIHYPCKCGYFPESCCSCASYLVDQKTFVQRLRLTPARCGAGTLIMAPVNRFYLLTADHCFVDKKAINNFEYW